MVTKGIIQTLDLLGNTCTVRMPLFETSGNDEITGTATISNTPGSYNGYRVGDVVWIAFEDGQMNTPVVIGKLYLGAEAERNDPRGVINVESSTVTKNAVVPADTKLTAQIDSNMPNTNLPYSSLYSVANNLNTLNTTVAQNDRDYGNRFKQVATEIDTQGTQFRSALTQTAKEIRAEVSAIETDLDGKITDTNSILTQTAGEIRAEVNQVEIELDGKITATNSKLDLTADNINAEVSTKVSSNSDTAEQAFGWNLKSDEWTVYNKTNEVVTNVTDLWVDIIQKVVKVEETADDGTTIEKDAVKQYYAVNNIVTTREVKNGESLPTVESTGDSAAPWVWADIESGSEKTIQVIDTNNETKPLTDILNVKKVLIANKDGLEVRGKIEAERGHIGSFTIGDESNGHSGIYSDDYKDKNGKYITSFKNNGENWEFKEDAEGVYIGTDGIRLGSNFSVDTTGHVTATSIKITPSGVEGLGDLAFEDSLSASDVGAVATDDLTNPSSGPYEDIVDIAGGVIDARKLKANELEVYTDVEKTKPILLANVNGSGTVTIGGFSVSENTLSAEGKIQIKNSETGEEEEVDSKVSISTDAISVGPIDQTNNNIPLVISGTGEIIASKGSFSGQITASGAELKDTSYFSMAADGEALFNILNANSISASDNISTKGRINSNKGYFFGPEADCGLSLEGTVQYIEQDCKISISASHMLVGGGTNNRYRITVSCKPAATKPIKITFSKAQWGTGRNAITIVGGELTINAGSTSASTQRTVPNTSKYQLIYTTYASIGGGSSVGGTNNPTSITTSPEITKIEVDDVEVIPVEGKDKLPANSCTIKQTTPSKSSNLKLDCESFKMNGNIIIPNTATFKVKGDSDNNVVILNKEGLQTDGVVKFKVGSEYHEPAIRLMTDGSPNCFWSKSFEIGGSGGSGWKSVTLPGELQDSSGSSGNNSKIIAVLATGKFPKNVDNKDPDSGDAQGATFYTWWDGTHAYVYNPISKAPKTSVINIVVLGKL